MKIHYFDFVAQDGIHASFNAAMIEVLCAAYPEHDEITLHCEKKHGKIVQKKCVSRIQVRARTAVDAIKYRKVKDMLNGLYVFLRILFKNKDDVFFIGIAFPFAVNAIYRSSKLFKKSVFLCLHGELQYLLDCDESIFPRKSRRYFSRMRHAFSRKNTYLLYVLLGKTIYDSAKHLFHAENRLIVINHPALFPEKYPAHKLHTPVVIAQIGTALKRKGSRELFALADLLKTEIKEGKIVIAILGQCGSEFPEKDSGLVRCYDRPLSDEELHDRIAQIDFSLQLTTDSICTAIASGTLVDSLMHGKPIIGLHSAYLDSYTNGTHQASLVRSTVEELAELIRDIARNCTDKDYESYVASAIAMGGGFSVRRNAELLRQGVRG